MIRRLHRDDSAQVTFLALAASLVLIGTMAMIINTGDVTRTRIRNQEVADVTALAAATWTARGLNTVSMLNVMNSKLLSMTVLVNALDNTLPTVLKIARAQFQGFTACTAVPIVGAFCGVMATVVSVQQSILTPLYETAIRPLAANVTKYCSGVAWNIMKGLSAAAEGVRHSFTRIGYAEAVAIAQANGASFGIAVEGSLLQLGDSNLSEAGALPVSREDRELKDFCASMRDGGPGFVMQGYDAGEGPAQWGRQIWKTIFYPFVQLFPHPIFYAAYNREMNRLGCDGTEGEDEGQEVEFFNLADCRKYGARATWSRFSDNTDWVDEANWGVDDFIAFTPDGVQNKTVSAEDLERYSELGSDISGAASELNHRPIRAGRQALINERDRGTQTASCGSGYATAWYTAPGSIVPSRVGLNRHPDYMHYEVTSDGLHRRARSAPFNENTGTYFLYVEREDREVTLEDGTKKKEYRYSLDEFILSSAGKKKLEGEELDEYLEEEYGAEAEGLEAEAGASCGEFPIPHLLVEESDDRLRFFAVVKHELNGDSGQNGKPFWSNYFTASPTSFTGFSQAQVYNDLSTDMFTQDWRVRLERTTLLEAALSRVEEMGLGTIAETASDVLTTVNNH